MAQSSFRIPDAFLQKLYELTGSQDQYKGFLLFCFDAKGKFTPLLAKKDPVIEMALIRGIEEWLDKINSGESMMISEQEMA